MPKKRKVEAAPAVESWLQPWSEPVRALTAEDVAQMRRKAKADQAALARAAKVRAKNPAKREQLAAIRQELAIKGRRPKLLLEPVNDRLLKRRRKPISIKTLYRRLAELKKK
jgi:hypothetical protein